jgi:RNA polymerase sigma-70 factor (ECF subfamily)
MPTEKKYEQKNVLKLLSQDSQYTFQLIFDRHRDRIYKVSLLYLKSPILAEEIVQDTFLKLWFKRKDLAEIVSLEAWLYTVSKNLILNYLKKISHEWTLRKDFNSSHEQSECTTDFKLLDSEFNQLFHKALSGLSEQQRLVYVLAKEEGLSYEEIGKKLSISPLTVKTHMSRALTFIRGFLQEHGHILPFLLVSSLFFH